MALTDIESGRLADNVFDVVGPNKNLIINGAMQVSQRATQRTGVTTTDYQTCDRFELALGSLGTWTVDQDTNVPDGFSKSFKVTCTTANASPAASAIAYIRHRIEAQNLQHLKFGTAAAQPLTLSFWVRSNKTGNATCNIRQPDDSFRMVGFQYSISAADTWEFKTISIPADTAGTIDNDNGSGLQLEWYLNSGSDSTSGSHQATWTANATANLNPSNLGVGGAVSDYFQITGVQLEVGSVATPFEHRTLTTEITLCQRYYIASQFSIQGNALSSGFVGGWIQFATPMRIAPTAVISTVGKFPASLPNPTVGVSETQGIRINVQNTTGSNQTNIAIGSAYTADAEL